MGIRAQGVEGSKIKLPFFRYCKMQFTIASKVLKTHVHARFFFLETDNFPTFCLRFKSQGIALRMRNERMVHSKLKFGKWSNENLATPFLPDTTLNNVNNSFLPRGFTVWTDLKRVIERSWCVTCTTLTFNSMMAVTRNLLDDEVVIRLPELLTYTVHNSQNSKGQMTG